MTNANVEKKKKERKNSKKTQIIPEVNNYEKMKQTSRNKRVFLQKLY